jgi:glycosyltransferase involved in cell wall biosynthesis
MERAWYDHSHILHVLSGYTLGLLRALYGNLLAQKATLIPWYYERETWEESEDLSPCVAEQLSCRQPLLFSMRRLVPRMGLDVLLRAAARMADQCAFRLVIAGDGPEKGALEQEAKRLHISEKVCFCGRITDAEAAAMYRAAKLFILPSVDLECFGLIVLEAYGRGCPVVAAHVGALAEIVGAVTPELLFPPGDERALADLLKACLLGSLPIPGRIPLESLVARDYSKSRILPRYFAMLSGQQYLHALP